MRTPRRRFLQSLLGAAGLAALGAPARALTPAHGAPDAWQAGFDAALADQPWLAAYAGVQVDAPTLPMTLQGRWPQDLRGSLYRNGAARFGLAGQRYHHWFDGDGMVQKYEIGAGGMGRVWRARDIRLDREVAIHEALAQPLDGQHEERTRTAGRVEQPLVGLAFVAEFVQHVLGEPVGGVVFAEVVANFPRHEPVIQLLEQVAGLLGADFKRAGVVVL